MPLTAPQKTIASSDKRFRVAICGRRFGKTHLAVRELARFASQPRKRCWFIAPTRGQAKGIVWDQLKGRLQDLRWIAKVNESELTIHLVNGSEISLKSADAYDRMRGYSVSFVVLDEFADMDERTWTALRPTLSDQEGHALFIGTPRGMGNWSKDMFDMSISNDSWASFQFTTIDGGQVSKEEIEAARQELDEQSFREEYLATFESKSGRIFYAFDRQHNLRAWDKPLPYELHIGMDFNVSPLTAVVFAREGNTMTAIDEIRIFGSNTDEMVEEIKTRYPTQRIIVWPDPSGRARKTSAGGRTDHTILQMAGFTVRSPHVHNAVRDGINAVNARLCSSTGVRNLFIDPRLKYTIETLEKFSYKPDTSVPDKDSGFDHMGDCIRYCVEGNFPIRQAVAAMPIKTWGHKLARV
jgi:hypothetical protein